MDFAGSGGGGGSEQRMEREREREKRENKRERRGRSSNFWKEIGVFVRKGKYGTLRGLLRLYLANCYK